MHLKSLIVLAYSACAAASIWPAPESFTNGSTTLWISRDISIGIDVSSVNGQIHTGDLSDSRIVRDALTRALDTIQNNGLVPWTIRPRHSNFEPSTGNKRFVHSLHISQRGNASSLIPSQSDESYTLTLSEAGAARITSNSTAGTLHALQSFTQLFYKHSTGGAYTTLAPVSIKDAPKLKLRGINLDVARSWYPVETILKTIDSMSWNKLNTLHLHMTDSQSWPLEVPAMPELSEKGSYYKGLTYSPADIEHIQRYALQRGVSVYIEIDMPGHTTSIGLSHPELLTAAYAKPWGKYCAEPPCGALQLNNPKVSSFLDTLFSDILPRVKNYSPFFHIGGDEVNPNTYSLDPTVGSSDRNVIRPYIQRFVTDNEKRVQKAKLAPIVWEEMVTEWNLTLAKDTVLMAWYTPIRDLVASGHRIIAAGKPWYLDCGRGAWINYENGPQFDNNYPFLDYCSPVKGWRTVYAFDPWQDVPDNKKHLVIGGQVHMWSEQADYSGLESLLWPRAAAAAEVLWSGRQDASGQNRSQMVAAPRLTEMRERMVARGVLSAPVHMPFCTQDDPHQCGV